jgi:hypothetical protein
LSPLLSLSGISPRVLGEPSGGGISHVPTFRVEAPDGGASVSTGLASARHGVRAAVHAGHRTARRHVVQRFEGSETIAAFGSIVRMLARMFW